jgi:O-antigen/teichoic acid export membrane protein
LTRISTPEVIGISSTVISLANILSAVAMMGVPQGVSRFLAKSYHEKNVAETSAFLRASLFMVAEGILISFVLLMLVKDWVYITVDANLTILTILLTGSTSIAVLNRSIVIASLKTQTLPVIMVVSSASRIVIVVLLVLMNTGATGIVTGYASFEILSSILLGFAIYGIYKPIQKNISRATLYAAFKNLFGASIPTWIPRIVATLGGSNLGTIVVFGFNGASQAGAYFIANAIYSAISTISVPLYTIAYPALSAMTDGRKRLAWRIIKISVVFSLPLSFSVFFYSDDIVGLLGNHYADSSLLLKIFMLSILPNSIYSVVTQLVYAYGNYRQVLILGLAASVPRSLLYFILVPSFGSEGAVISFLIGTLIGCAFSIIIAKRIEVIIRWKSLGFISAISFFPAFVFSLFQINYIVGITGTIVISLVLFLKFRVLTRYDVEDTVNVLPIRLARPIALIFTKIGILLNKDY